MNPETLLNPVYGACFSEDAILINCCIDIDFDILERQEDALERQENSSERRDGNGEDYGHRERLTAVMCERGSRGSINQTYNSDYGMVNV